MGSLAASLVNLQEKISEITTSLNRARGQRDFLKASLKKDFGLDSVKEAQKVLKNMREEITTQEEELTKKIRDLEEKYGLRE